MKLMINHQTHYEYTEPAQNSIQYIKMSPQNNNHQKILSWGVSVPGESHTHRDAFDNIWMTCSQRYTYQRMTIMAQGIIEINCASTHAIDLSISPYVFLQMTPFTQCSEAMKQFAQSYVSQRQLNEFHALSQALIEYMPYTQATTQVCTTAVEAFQHRLGVCQDHSHVFIAMCRSLGVPARYVSGYLYVADSAHLASHAWAEIYLNHQWHTFDISNQLYTPSSHIYVAIGRDYWDVAPIRGVREKGGVEHMMTHVQVLPC